jgi:hypothetical protein
MYESFFLSSFPTSAHFGALARVYPMVQNCIYIYENRFITLTQRHHYASQEIPTDRHRFECAHFVQLRACGVSMTGHLSFLMISYRLQDSMGRTAAESLYK